MQCLPKRVSRGTFESLGSYSCSRAREASFRVRALGGSMLVLPLPALTYSEFSLRVRLPLLHPHQPRPGLPPHGRTHSVLATFCSLNVPATATARPSSTLIYMHIW